MKLWIEVFSAIGKNIGLLLVSWLKQVGAALRLGVLFRAIFWILGLPYEWFRKNSEDGRIEFSKSAAPQHAAGALILELLFLPYHCYLDSTDGLGESEHDKEALKFWFTVGWLSIPAVIFLIFYFTNYSRATG